CFFGIVGCDFPYAACKLKAKFNRMNGYWSNTHHSAALAYTNPERHQRFFGTPTFQVAQTVIVGVCILISSAADSASPDVAGRARDKMTAMAEAQHREEIARTGEERQCSMAQRAALLTRMLEQNTH